MEKEEGERRDRTKLVGGGCRAALACRRVGLRLYYNSSGWCEVTRDDEEGSWRHLLGS